jgi:predicted enzyme related to lactoylglutathione lyase
MKPGFFGWHDLASDDVERAAAFYAATFGWQCRPAHANGGVFHFLSSGGRDFASLYRIGGPARARGLTAHWTPYVAVPSVHAAVDRVVDAGGGVAVQPFDVAMPGLPRMARIALAGDPDGATFGLWEIPAPPAR